MDWTDILSSWLWSSTVLVPGKANNSSILLWRDYLQATHDRYIASPLHCRHLRDMLFISTPTTLPHPGKHRLRLNVRTYQLRQGQCTITASQIVAPVVSAANWQQHTWQRSTPVFSQYLCGARLHGEVRCVVRSSHGNERLGAENERADWATNALNLLVSTW